MSETKVKVRLMQSAPARSLLRAGLAGLIFALALTGVVWGPSDAAALERSASEDVGSGIYQSPIPELWIRTAPLAGEKVPGWQGPGAQDPPLPGQTCLPTDVVEDPKLDFYKPYEAHYMPEVQIEWVDVAMTYINADDEIAYSCTEGVQMSRILSADKGAGKGWILFDLEGDGLDPNCKDFKVCRVSFAGKTYDLKSKSVRASLDCVIPGIVDAGGGSYCFRVPKTPGKYSFDLYRSNGRIVERGAGWRWVCRWNYNYVACGWENDEDIVYYDTVRDRKSVTVTPGDVIVKKIR